METPLTDARFTVWCSCGKYLPEVSILEATAFIGEHPDCRTLYCVPLARLVYTVIAEAERIVAGTPEKKRRWRK